MSKALVGVFAIALGLAACGKSDESSAQKKRDCTGLTAIFERNVPKAFAFLEAEYDDPNFAAAPHQNAMEAANKVITQLETIKPGDPELAKLAGQTALIMKDYAASLGKMGEVLSKMSEPSPELKQAMDSLETAAVELNTQCESKRPGCEEIFALLADDSTSSAEAMPVRIEALKKLGASETIKDKAISEALSAYVEALAKTTELLNAPDKKAASIHVIEAKLRSYLQAVEDNRTRLRAVCSKN